MVTFCDTGGINTTSPDCNNKSLVESPLMSKSYKSKVVTNLPARLSCMLRNEPMLLMPPAANNAWVMLDKELNV